MKEICIDARMLNASGIGVYLQNILPYLEHQFKLVLLGNEDEIRRLNLKSISVIPSEVPIYSVKEQWEIPYKIPRTDLFWSPHYNVPLLPVRAGKRITTIHDVFHLRFSHTLSSAQKLYARLMLNAAVRNSDHLITVSEFSKTEIRSFLPVPESKLTVVYNGVSQSFFQPLSEVQKETIRHRYALPENYILFVGNLKPHKNLTTLLDTFSLLKKKSAYSNFKMVVVGKRKGFITGISGLDQLIDNLSLGADLLFLEDVLTQELPVIYSLAKALAFPSLYEGFGLPPLEAMACGCPTVVSKISCLEEIYGNHSYFVSPEDPQEISNGIARVLDDTPLRSKFIEEGKVFAKKFTWEASAIKHLHMFDKLLNSSGK